MTRRWHCQTHSVFPWRAACYLSHRLNSLRSIVEQSDRGLLGSRSSRCTGSCGHRTQNDVLPDRPNEREDFETIVSDRTLLGGNTDRRHQRGNPVTEVGSPMGSFPRPRINLDFWAGSCRASDGSQPYLGSRRRVVSWPGAGVG